MELVFLASLWPTPSWLSKRKSYPLTTHTFFFVGVNTQYYVTVRHVTETGNLHTQVTSILLSAEICITVMKNDRKC